MPSDKKTSDQDRRNAESKSGQESPKTGTDAGSSAASSEPKWREDQLREAEELGLSNEQAVSLGDPDKILAALGAVQRKHASRKPAEQSADEKPKKQSGPDLKKLRDEGFDDVAEALEGFGGSVSEVRRLVEELKAERERDKEAKEADFKARVDQMIDNLGDKYADQFADSSRMAPINRKRVREEMRDRAEWYRSRKKAVPSDSKLLREALDYLWPESEPKSPAAASTARIATTVRQPSHVNGEDTRPPRERALSFIRQFKAERGL